MNALFRWLDVDGAQWRALLKASLRTDFEALRTKFRMQGRQSEGQLATLIVVCFLYTFSGVSPAWFAFINPDPLFGATMLALIVGFMVMSTLLVGEGVAVAAADDFMILGFRPVTSRTYFAVRVAALLVRTFIICTLVSLGTVGVNLFRGGLHPERAIGALLASYLTGIAVTFAIVALYGWVLQLAGPRRLMRWSSYMQFLAQMVTFVGFMVSTQQMGRDTIKGITLSGTNWAILFPGSWFGSWVMLSSGVFTWMTIVPALLSLATVALIGRSIGGKLSLGYLQSLSLAATAGDAPPAKAASTSRSWMRGLTNETRAIAILVRSHFRYDMRFRLGIISLIPITIAYMWMGGWPRDPFIPRSLMEMIGDDAHNAARKANSEFLVIMALMFLPLSLRRVIMMSTNYRASWIYRVAPSNLGKLVMSTRSVITGFFMVPYLLFIGVMYLIAFRNAGHAVIHTFFMGLLAFNSLQLTMAADPQLPFSTPAQKDAEGGIMMVTMFVSLIFGVGLYFLLTKVVYQSALYMAVAAAGLIGLALLLDWLTRSRAAKRLSAVEAVV